MQSPSVVVISHTTLIEKRPPFSVPIYTDDWSTENDGELKQEPPSKYTLCTTCLSYNVMFDSYSHQIKSY